MYNRLKELRTLELITQEDLAKLLDVKQNAYCEYEREYYIIPIKHLITLCDYFHVSLDYIFSFSDIKNYKNIKNKVDKNLSGIRLKELRIENGLVQNDLAKLLKCSDSTIRAYEKGRNLIATPFLYTICRDYHISADYLLGRTNTPKYLK